MLIIAGHVTVDPEERDELVERFADLVRRSREAPGCLDAALTADSVDPSRINNFERWRSWEELDAWRARCDAPDVGDAFLAVDVSMFDASGERSPFP
ncbi:putative quinol monooxygenase [Actinomycetospora termitidis]|uniref:Antibiotic biosynthesis monooxygenase family protein n=1 Tax=Actinomycetospora termitidis TaxID=3053470 RepID=A0ABT7MDL1_9PSEU|nr:antibiotic biosynthesis monooxygenase family protein [Actinomycetospora sp. Odt1-22]MDL5158754.1 antibiotic biosynthesis monooxygenase family protein [Actinomycetospora sp. Odt1-22]